MYVPFNFFSQKPLHQKCDINTKTCRSVTVQRYINRIEGPQGTYPIIKTTQANTTVTEAKLPEQGKVTLCLNF